MISAPRYTTYVSARNATIRQAARLRSIPALRSAQ